MRFADEVSELFTQQWAYHHPRIKTLTVKLEPDVFERRELAGACELKSAFERFVREGKIVDLPTTSIVRIVASVFIGYVLVRIVFVPDRDWDDEAEIDTMLRVLLEGLKPREPKEATRGSSAPTTRRKKAR